MVSFTPHHVKSAVSRLRQNLPDFALLSGQPVPYLCGGRRISQAKKTTAVLHQQIRMGRKNEHQARALAVGTRQQTIQKQEDALMKQIPQGTLSSFGRFGDTPK
jgi:hypothetical protein